MRTTAPNHAGRQVGIAALRTRLLPLAAAVLMAAALVLSMVGQAGAQSAGANGVTWHRTGNLLHTPYFEYRQWPWVGTGLTRHYLSSAPSGHWVAQFSQTSNRVVLDDWPGEVHSVRGAHYTASMSFRSFRYASWEHPITLVIREHGPYGGYVTSRSVTTPLRAYWKRLSVTLTALRGGDTIDVYAYQSRVWHLSAVWADNASLIGEIPVNDPPSNPPSTPPTSSSPPPGGDGPSTLGLLAYATGQPTDLGDTSKYAYVVVQENQFSHIAEIKRQNPNTKVLAYMQAGNTHYYDSCSDTTDPHIYGDAYGVSYCYANRFHPEWFLTDRSGNRMHAVDYPFLMPMDVGNTAFDNTWAVGTYNNLKQDGFDGVWMDDVNIDPGHGFNGRFAKYTDEQYGAATTKFASYVGDYFRSRGMLALANVGTEPWVAYQMNDILAMGRHLTAINREHYVRYGDICGPFGERFNNTAQNGTPPLSTFLDETTRLQAQGTKFTGVDYGYTTPTDDDRLSMTYGRALFLLSWNGTAGSAYFFRRCGVNDTAEPEWTVSIGTPTGPIQTDANGIMTRMFTHGEVVLNPNRSGGNAFVRVPPGLHTMSGSTPDGGVNVGPQTAAILSS